jgi:hypothetical protein
MENEYETTIHFKTQTDPDSAVGYPAAPPRLHKTTPASYTGPTADPYQHTAASAAQG